MHGNLSQNARERNLAAFSDGTATALVATDIAARGIHVDDVDLVIHADPPIEHKAYTHRSGRTARAGAAGEVVTIATPDQVAEVKALLRKAGVTATWSGIPTSGRTADASAPVARKSSAERPQLTTHRTRQVSAGRQPGRGRSGSTRPGSTRSGAGVR
jgi:superfamily II DNA/RNA helicase